MNNLDKYISLYKELIAIRKINGDEDPEYKYEDPILDKLDEIWFLLTDEEIKIAHELNFDNI